MHLCYFFWSPVFFFVVDPVVFSSNIEGRFIPLCFLCVLRGLRRTLLESSHVIKYQTATTKTSIDELMLGCTFYMFKGENKNMAASLQALLESRTNTWMGVFSLTRVKDEFTEKIETHIIVRRHW